MAKKLVDKEVTVEEKLKTLYFLQQKLSEIDNIKILRGELPLEVGDLEDEIIGLETRIKKYETELKEADTVTCTRYIVWKEESCFYSRVNIFRASKFVCDARS